MSFGLIAAVLNATQKTLPDHVTTEADRVIAAIPAASSGSWQFEEFLTSGTWTRPAGVDVVWVLAVGAGAGGSRNSSPGANAGGGGGEIVFKPVNVTGNVTVTVGAGGVGRTGSTGDGGAGGDSSFGSGVIARGAPGTKTAVGGTGNNYGIPGGAWDVATTFFRATSMFGCPGGYGGDADASTENATGIPGFGNPGTGAGSGGGSFGDGGNGGTTPAAAAANSGGGGGSSTVANTDGANGGSGRVQVFWFI